MAKTIVGEDGKKYKEKKPFYKRVWFWILAVIVIAIIASQMGGNTNKTESNNTETKTSQSSSKDDKGKIGLKEFSEIKLGDGSMTFADAEAKYGKANSTSDTSIGDQSGKMATWDKIVKGGDFVSTFSLTFVNDQADSKSIAGLKVSRKNKLTLSDFDSIQNGTSREDVINKLGDPNGITESKILDTDTEILMYTSDIKGDMGANFNITLTNGVVSGKTQSSMN